MDKNYLLLQILNGRDIILSSSTNSRLVLRFVKDLGAVSLIFEKRESAHHNYERILVDPLTLTLVYSLIENYFDKEEHNESKLC